MKTILTRLASFAVLLALGCGLLGCSSLLTRISGVGHAITGETATLTVEVIATTVDAIKRDAVKAYRAGDITKAQFDKIAELDARYLPVYQAEKNAIEKNGASNAPSANLTQYLAQFYALAESFKKPATTTPAK